MSEMEPKVWTSETLPGRIARLRRVRKGALDLIDTKGTIEELLADNDDRNFLQAVADRARRDYLEAHAIEIMALAAQYLSEELAAARDALAESEAAL